MLMEALERRLNEKIGRLRLIYSRKHLGPRSVPRIRRVKFGESTGMGATLTTPEIFKSLQAIDLG
jgi:hypothetical protein